MKYQVNMLFALLLCGALCVPLRAQEAARPAASSPIQKMLAVDQLVEDKQYDEAIRGYNELLAADPRNPQLLNRLGNTYLAMQNMREARRNYDRALKADPHYAVAINNIGCLYYNDHNYGKAVRFYRRAIKTDPNVASFHSNLAFSYLAQKKYPEMMESFRQAASLDPTVFDQRNRSGAIILERGVPDTGALYFYLAKTFGQMGDLDHCLEYLTKARDAHYKNILKAKTDPAFDSVRSKPAMKEFMDRLVA